MRLEATVTDARHEQIQELADEMNISKSQVIDEAVALFAKAVIETKHGRRIAIIDADTREPVAEIVSPSLTTLEWASHRKRLTISKGAMGVIGGELKKPSAPTRALRKAFARHKR
jgi:hypothetical protein